MKPVYLYRPFILLWVGMLFSMTGTTLFLLVLSTKFFVESKSNFLAGSVFATQWFGTVFFFAAIGFLCLKFLPKKLLPVVEIVSGSISLLIGFFYNYGYFFVLLMLSIRGFLEGTMKSSRMIALKMYIQEEQLEKASSIFNSSYFLGAGLGGVIGALIANYLTIRTTAIIDAFSFVLAAFCYFFLPSLEKNEINTQNTRQNKNMISWRDIKGIFESNPYLLEYFSYLVISTAIYQGYHTIARTTIPLTYLGLGIQGVTIYQTVGCISLVTASVFAYKFLCRPNAVFSHPVILIGLSSCTMILTQFPINLAIGLLSYFLFIFCLETTYIKCSNFIIINCSKDVFAKYSVFSYSALTASMVLIVFIGGKLMDFLGFRFATFILAGVGFTISLFVLLKRKLSKEALRNV